MSSKKELKIILLDEASLPKFPRNQSDGCSVKTIFKIYEKCMKKSWFSKKFQKNHFNEYKEYQRFCNEFENTLKKIDKNLDLENLHSSIENKLENFSKHCNLYRRCRKLLKKISFAYNYLSKKTPSGDQNNFLTREYSKLENKCLKVIEDYYKKSCADLPFELSALVKDMRDRFTDKFNGKVENCLRNLSGRVQNDKELSDNILANNIIIDTSKIQSDFNREICKSANSLKKLVALILGKTLLWDSNKPFQERYSDDKDYNNLPSDFKKFFNSHMGNVGIYKNELINDIIGLKLDVSKISEKFDKVSSVLRSGFDREHRVFSILADIRNLSFIREFLENKLSALDLFKKECGAEIKNEVEFLATKFEDLENLDSGNKYFQKIFGKDKFLKRVEKISSNSVKDLTDIIKNTEEKNLLNTLKSGDFDFKNWEFMEKFYSTYYKKSDMLKNKLGPLKTEVEELFKKYDSFSDHSSDLYILSENYCKKVLKDLSEYNNDKKKSFTRVSLIEGANNIFDFCSNLNYLKPKFEELKEEFKVHETTFNKLMSKKNSSTL